MPCPPSGKGLLVEQLFTDPAGVLGGRHCVAHCPRVGEDLVVIPALQIHKDVGASLLLGAGGQGAEELVILPAGRLASVT